MSKIEMKNGKLIIPNKITIPFIEGDGVGTEITQISQMIVNEAVKKAYNGEKSIEWLEVLAGDKAQKELGTPLPDETIKIFEEYFIGIKGPLTTPVGEGMRSLNVALRQTLDLYVCLRPIRWFKGTSSPIKEPNKVNMIVFRENTEDIYAGIEWKTGTEEADKFYNFLKNEMGISKVRFPKTSSFGVKPVSEEGSKRLIASAIEYAVENKLPSVTLVHKGNIMKFTEGGFKKYGYELARKEFADKTFTMEEYAEIKKEFGEDKAKEKLKEAKEKGKVIIKDNIADAFLQNTLLKPEDYSVIATLNLNGDYISDQLAAMVGGIGIAPGGNINYETGHAIFEATHGTAPDIAGKNKANPSSLILSSVMALEYINMNEAAQLIINALEKSFESGYATEDLANFMDNGKALGTKNFGEKIISLI
ncbi:NADP-dependent isocitrate dehydrogenase [uncultured Brachyspira sp.]|uniref:NADP-dependent isocitrate dehydrogenase n=1 Tax=uncultured Brachyspira sp. TaxID=221953 RepID=UPI0025F10FF7|nr:NADP-dependent isocitrate dehydrogenase [uncultured Brachyspira sp.]